MIFVGIVFVALASGCIVGIIADNANSAESVTLATLVGSFHGMSVAGVFLLGAAVTCVFHVGFALIAAGVRRGSRVRRELRDLRYQQDESVQILLAEKAQLERELARERRRSGETIVSRGAGATITRGADVIVGHPLSPSG